MSYLLLQILEDDIPPHVHVGILLAATVPSSASEDAATTVSYVDLTSPTPHLLQFVQYAGDSDNDDSNHQNNDNDGAPSSTSGLSGLLETMALVPADSLHLPNLHAAIRSLVDYDPSQLATTQRAYTMSMPLGTSIETILDFMDQAQHPGAVASKSSTANDDDTTNPLEDQLWYAGGKIMTFLASCPTDLRGEDWRPLTQKSLPRTTVGLGGFGGAVQKTAPTASYDSNGGTSFDTTTSASGASSFLDEEKGGTVSNGSSSAIEILDTDMTPSSLLDYYRAPEHVEAYFSELGSQCAEAALGVDIFVMVQPKEDEGAFGSSSDYGNSSGDAELDVGLPFLRGLADRSGAPGPLVFPLHQGYSTPISDNPNIQRLKREVCARVPWGVLDGAGTRTVDHPMAFGGELRLRLSPSYEVDRSAVDEVDEGPQLAPLYSSGGIMGPASEEDESGNLWRLGTCDPFTTVTVDLDMKDKTAQDLLKVDGMGQISWKPVLQTCFAYTIIVRDPEQPGEYLTVRQMRIASARAPLTDSVETLYSSIDPEVIGSVLFHKLTLTLLRDGLSNVQTIGEDWLKSLLVCAYQSAETQEALQRDQAEHGLPLQNDANGDGEHTDLTFYANERLLDREGELSAEDVLLAQGHELLKTLPLVVYSLLQCDAIRPSSLSKAKGTYPGYCPTMDSRCAAGAQMSSMIPPVLAKCIAPRLQMWSCNEGLILDMIDLQMQAINISVEEFGNDPKSGSIREDLVLFLDSPYCIVICAASYFGNNQKPSRRKKKKTTIGPELQNAIDAAVSSYRTPPALIYDLGEESTATNQQPGYLCILASLVEDLPGNKGAANFKQWADNLAGEIHA